MSIDKDDIGTVVVAVMPILLCVVWIVYLTFFHMARARYAGRRSMITRSIVYRAKAMCGSTRVTNACTRNSREN